MQLGTVAADPGETATGYFDATELPTGGTEQLPVVLVNGVADGPELWITGSIHGDEATGLAVAQETIQNVQPEQLSGRVVCIPNLNPAGLRRNERTSYYDDDDPNRQFPDPNGESYDPPNVQQLINERVYEAFEGRADALVDLHTAQVGSVPFNIRHRVFYGGLRTEDEAEELAAAQQRLMDAFGLPVVNQYAGEKYTEKNLQRSTTGAAINNAGIPAMTVELGTHSVVDHDLVAAGVAGCHRVMAVMGILDEVPAEIEDADPGYEKPVDYTVRRERHPHTDTAGIVKHHVEPGDPIEAGDPIADIRTPHGEHKTTIESDHDGYVIGHREGAAVYENDPLCSMVVRDDEDIVIPRDSEE